MARGNQRADTQNAFADQEFQETLFMVFCKLISLQLNRGRDAYKPC